MLTEALNVLTVSFTRSLFLKQAERKPRDQDSWTWIYMSHLILSISARFALSLSGECVCVFPIADRLKTKTLSIHKSQKGRNRNQNLHKRRKDYSLYQIAFSLKSVSILLCSNNFVWWYSAFLASRTGESLSSTLIAQHSCREHICILRAGKTSEFFLSLVDLDRKKEVKVCGHGWSRDLQVRSVVNLVSWLEPSKCQGGYCTVC